MANLRPRARNHLARRHARSFKVAGMLGLSDARETLSVACFGWQLFETPGAAFCSQRLHRLSAGRDSVNDCDHLAMSERSRVGERGPPQPKRKAPANRG